MLWSQIIITVSISHKNRTILWQEESNDKKYFRHRTLPDEVYVLLKIPVRRFVGPLKVWHRPGTVNCPDGARPAFAYIGRAPDDFGLKFKSYDFIVRAPADVLWVELPPVRSDMYLQKYIMHLHRYFTSEDQKNKHKNIYFAWAAEDEQHATNKCY